MTREEAIAILDGFKHNPLFNEQHFEALDMAISALSEERPKGEWIEHEMVYECSNCQIIRAKGRTGRYNFCPNCGAMMNEENNNVNE